MFFGFWVVPVLNLEWSDDGVVVKWLVELLVGRQTSIVEVEVVRIVAILSVWELIGELLSICYRFWCRYMSRLYLYNMVRVMVRPVPSV